MIPHPSMKVREGYKLVELVVLMVAVGVLAAFGVPRFLNSVERSKASEAVAFLSAIQAAQERYVARQGVYATNLADLDITVTPPKSFTVSPITQSNTPPDPTWTMTLTRIAATSSKGRYTVVFNQDGFDKTNSSIVTVVPEANPFGP